MSKPEDDNEVELKDDYPPEPQMDWQQVVLNGGPPCFYFEAGDTHYCGRVERWAGHGVIHPYIDLETHIYDRVEAICRVKEILTRATPTTPVDAEAERIRIIAYLSYDTAYSDDFCLRCSHCPSNCECVHPVYMDSGWTPDDKLKALKVALFQEDFATTPTQPERCEHGVPFSDECLSCGLPEYVAAQPETPVADARPLDRLKQELGQEPWSWEKIQVAFAKVSGNMESVIETEQNHKGPSALSSTPETPTCSRHGKVEHSHRCAVFSDTLSVVPETPDTVAETWVTCAQCGQKRSMATLESRDTFVCRYCLSTEAVDEIAREIVDEWINRDSSDPHAGVKRVLAATLRARDERAAGIARLWANSHSCDVHDDNPCCHVRTGAAIADRILNSKGEMVTRCKHGILWFLFCWLCAKEASDQ